MIPVVIAQFWANYAPRIISYGIVALFAGFAWWQVSGHYEAKGAAEAVRACNAEKRAAAAAHAANVATLQTQLDNMRAAHDTKASADESKIAELQAALVKGKNNSGKGGWSKDTAKKLGF